MIGNKVAVKCYLNCTRKKGAVQREGHITKKRLTGRRREEDHVIKVEDISPRKAHGTPKIEHITKIRLTRHKPNPIKNGTTKKNNHIYGT